MIHSGFIILEASLQVVFASNQWRLYRVAEVHHM